MLEATDRKQWAIFDFVEEVELSAVRFYRFQPPLNCHHLGPDSGRAVTIHLLQEQSGRTDPVQPELW